jgi:multiple sugar transport system ATP-binding protein
MTVRENVAFGLTIAGASKQEIDTKVAEAARMLKLEPLLDRKPAQLSGGQRQRVAIGRAIVRKPDVFLFDEPLSNLDAALRVATRAEIAKLHNDLASTMIYVTHDQVEAMTLADRIVVLDGGVVQQFGAPMDLYHNPANTFVAGFIGSPKMNFRPVTAVGAATASGVSVAGGGLQRITVPAKGAGVADGQNLTLGIRPEHVKVTRGSGGQMSGTVALIERLGHQTFLEIDLPENPSLTALVEGDLVLNRGDQVSASFDAQKAHLFTADGAAVARS